jgi:hypothetical protein
MRCALCGFTIPVISGMLSVLLCHGNASVLGGLLLGNYTSQWKMEK